jgi:hypothetical protein
MRKSKEIILKNSSYDKINRYNFDKFNTDIKTIDISLKNNATISSHKFEEFSFYWVNFIYSPLIIVY